MATVGLYSQLIQRRQGQIYYRLCWVNHADARRPSTENPVYDGFPICGINQIKRLNHLKKTFVDFLNYRWMAYLPKTMDVLGEHFQCWGYSKATSWRK